MLKVTPTICTQQSVDLMLTIGRIDYANCTPIFKALESVLPAGSCQFEPGVPSRLNWLLSDGAVDICPSSSIEYAQNPDRYLILPGLSISSIGAVASVLLFSSRPLEQLDGADILLTSDSATSVNLLKVLLKTRYGMNNRFYVSGTEHHGDIPAELQIGDRALRTAGSGDTRHCYDLGALWHDWTGYPFVFALWLCTRVAFRRSAAEVLDFSKNLVRAKSLALDRLEEIAVDAPEASWMGSRRLLAYWRTNLSFDLDQRHLRGLELFYEYCAGLGLIGRVPEMHFLKGE